jgi:hypothetical protein
MEIRGEYIKYNESLRELALRGGNDMRHHELVREIAQNIFEERCEKRAISKAHYQSKAQHVINKCRQRINKYWAGTLTSTAGAPSTACLLIPVVGIFPITAPLFLIPLAMAVGGQISSRKIDIKQEERKIWVYEHFCEAVVSKGIEKMGYDLLESIERSGRNAAELLKNNHMESDSDGDFSLNEDSFKKEIEDQIEIAKENAQPEIDALLEHIDKIIYFK